MSSTDIRHFLVIYDIAAREAHELVASLTR
jgi:hypothetical protein